MSLAFKPKGYQVQAFDPLLQEEKYILPAVPAEYIPRTTANILRLALYKDKFLFAGFRNEFVAVWNLHKRSLETVISVSKNQVWGVNVYKDYLVTACWAGDIKIYSILDNFSLVKVAAQFGNLMYCVEPSEKHQLLFTCGYTRTIHFIDVSDPSNANHINSRQVSLNESIFNVRVIDNETKLAAGDGSSLVIVDILTSTILHRLDKANGSPHTESIWTTAAINDKYVAAAGYDSQVSIWNYHTGKLHKVLKGIHDKIIYHMQLIQCHDGRHLLYSLDLRYGDTTGSTVCIWDVDKDFELVKHMKLTPDTDNYALTVLDNRQFSKTVKRFHQLLMQSWQVKHPLYADVTIVTQL